MSKPAELVTELREIFQLNKPELDFGIYRILNARAGEINEYLEQRRLSTIHTARNELRKQNQGTSIAE